MNIDLKDLLADEPTRVCLCQAIAEKLVENRFFEDVEKFDYNGCCTGFEEALREDISNTIKNVALEKAIKETEDMLKNDYDIRNKIRETIRNYIVEQFNLMTKVK